MLFTGFHALSRYNPHRGVEVEFVPSGAKHLARACGGEDGKLEGASARPFPFAKFCYERWHIGIRQSCMMLDRAHLGARWEKLVEMAAPAGRIFAFAIAAHPGPIEDAFNTATKP